MRLSKFSKIRESNIFNKSSWTKNWIQALSNKLIARNWNYQTHKIKYKQFNPHSQLFSSSIFIQDNYIPLCASSSWFLVDKIYLGDSGQKGSVASMKTAGTIINARRTGHRVGVPSSESKPNIWDISMDIVTTNWYTVPTWNTVDSC